MSERYWADDITGGVEGSLDFIDPNNPTGKGLAIVAGAICDVIQEDTISHYIIRDSSGAVEKYPDVILPDSNTANWWWELIDRTTRQEGMISQIVYENTPGAF